MTIPKKVCLQIPMLPDMELAATKTAEEVARFMQFATDSIDEIKQALQHGGSPATPDDLRKRFDTFMNERCKGKDATKLRFVIE